LKQVLLHRGEEYAGAKGKKALFPEKKKRTPPLKGTRDLRLSWEVSGETVSESRENPPNDNTRSDSRDERHAGLGSLRLELGVTRTEGSRVKRLS